MPDEGAAAAVRAPAGLRAGAALDHQQHRGLVSTSGPELTIVLVRAGLFSVNIVLVRADHPNQPGQRRGAGAEAGGRQGSSFFRISVWFLVVPRR